MLLKEITLNNFRQFKGKHTIQFSTSHDRNVTVIIGENGSGKTTLAQAFTWCLYGKTDFNNVSVLNLSYSKEMEETDTTTVFVELKLVHNNITYTIIRNQGYEKDRTGNIKAKPTKLNIHFKDSNGEIQTVKEIDLQSKIKEILPEELSRYFFFDGERIEKMSNEIQSGKSDEFAEAVKRILGLNTYVAAIRHLGGDKKPGSRTSVIGSYINSYSMDSDNRMKMYSMNIDKLQSEIDSLTARKDTLENEIPMIEKECEKLIEKIARNKDGEQIQKDCNRLKEDVTRNNKIIDSSTGKILDTFQNNYKFFFYKKIIGDVLEVLSSVDKVDKGIPELHERTVQFLLKRGFCICGNSICDGSSEKKALEDLCEYILPRSLGTTINYFSQQCKTRTESGQNLYDVTKGLLTDIENYRQINEDLQKNIVELEERIKTFEDIGKHQIRLISYKNDCDKKRQENNDLDIQIKDKTKERDRQSTEREKIALQSDNNKKIAIYTKYARRLYDILTSDYDKRETEIRKNLEDAINQIFLTIYNGGLSLKIDSKYQS